MCSIFGAVVYEAHDIPRLTEMILRMAVSGEDRGRDGTGIAIVTPIPGKGRLDTFRSPLRASECVDQMREFLQTYLSGRCTVVGNNRYQPLPQPDSINERARQPIFVDDVLVTHNGTFPEDDRLMEKYEFRSHTGIDTEVLCHMFRRRYGELANQDNQLVNEYTAVEAIQDSLKEIAGGYACGLVDLNQPHLLHLFRNFKPLWVGMYEADLRSGLPDPVRVIGRDVPVDYVDAISDHIRVLFFNSEKKNIEAGVGRRSHWLDKSFRVHQISAYTGMTISNDLETPDPLGQEWPCQNKIMAHLPAKQTTRALVICSGGMDSSLAAAVARKVEGHEVTLLHMDYGQKAKDREREAVLAVAKALDCQTTFIDVSEIGKWHADSPLTQGEVPQGVRSSESTLCWTAARNMVFLTLAAAYAEGQGFDLIYSGFNLEESGSYPDNTLEFFNRFDAFAEFGTLTRVKSRLSIARMMKTDIIRLAYHLGVPMGETWSCDTAGIAWTQAIGEAWWNLGKNHDYDAHIHRPFVPCGTCGCCTTRIWAHKRARVPDPQIYAKELVDLPPWWRDPPKPPTTTIEELIAEVQKHS